MAADGSEMAGGMGMQTVAHEMAARNGNAAKFAELVKVRTHNAKLISAEDETALLEDGVKRFNLTHDEARAVVYRVSEDDDVALQRDVEHAVKEMMEGFVANRRKKKIARSQFEHAVGFYRGMARNGIPEAMVRRRVKSIMIENQWLPKRNGMILRTKRWYKSIEPA